MTHPTLVTAERMAQAYPSFHGMTMAMVSALNEVLALHKPEPCDYHGHAPEDCDGDVPCVTCCEGFPCATYRAVVSSLDKAQKREEAAL